MTFGELRLLTKTADVAVKSPRLVLLGALILILLSAAFGSSVQSKLKAGGYASPKAEAANEYVHRHFPGANPNLIVMVSADDRNHSAQARATGQRIADDLRQRPDVASVHSWTDSDSGTSAALRGRDGRDGLILVDLAGDDTAAQEHAGIISREISGTSGAVTVRTGGEAGVFNAISARIAADLLVAEAIALPLTLILLMLVFGSLVAAGLPLAIGVFSIMTTLGVLRLLAAVTNVSIFALNMTTALGLALAIDYSLFIVSRYREELTAGRDTRSAVIRAIQTAGRTVVFSALTVAVSLGALTVFNAYFLRSFAYAGIAVVCAAALAAVFILPACLILIGDRINALDLRVPLYRLIGRTPGLPPPAERSGWYRLVTAVMKRPSLVALAVTAILLLLGSPFLGARLAYPDYRVLPQSAPSREVSEILRTQFPAGLSSNIVIALPGYHGPTGPYAEALSKVADVEQVTASDGVFVDGRRVARTDHRLMTTASGTYIAVSSDADPMSHAGSDQMSAIHAILTPAPVLFGGTAPVYKDALEEMYSKVPIALGIVAVTSLVVLFLFTGSILLPVEALLLNLLSLTATFGAMVWVFQDGHLSGLFNFTPTGYLNANMPPLMFCLAFGMSMDFEVFLLSRVREEWLASDRSATANTRAVAMGVSRTGRIFTAAAGLMAVVFLAIATSRVSSMQMFGIGLALAVIADATLIRLFLAPALMKLMNTANWWLPAPLAAIHRHLGISEAPSQNGQPLVQNEIRVGGPVP